MCDSVVFKGNLKYSDVFCNVSRFLKLFRNYVPHLVNVGYFSEIEGISCCIGVFSRYLGYFGNLRGIVVVFVGSLIVCCSGVAFVGHCLGISSFLGYLGLTSLYFWVLCSYCSICEVVLGFCVCYFTTFCGYSR